MGLQGQIEQIREFVRREDTLLHGLLEYNSAALILNGIAHKVQAYDASISSAYTPPVEVDTTTQFQVSQSGAYFPAASNSRALEPNSVCVNIYNHHSLENGTGVMDIYQIGKRVVQNGEVVDVAVDLPGIDDQDVLLAGSLIDLILAEVNRGLLPHLSERTMNVLQVSPDEFKVSA